MMDSFQFQLLFFVVISIKTIVKFMAIIFQVHIKFQNAEPLIEKFNKDLFERYELVNELNRGPSSRTSTTTNTTRSTSSQNHRTIHEEDYIYKQRSTSNSTSKPPTNRVPVKQQQQAPVVFKPEPVPQQPQPAKNQYFYYDTVNKDLVDINSIDHRELKQISSFTQNFNSATNTSTISNSSSSNKTSNMVESLKIVYPLSFIDSVNKKQLNLDSGLFRDPKTGKHFGILYNLCLGMNRILKNQIHKHTPIFISFVGLKVKSNAM